MNNFIEAPRILFGTGMIFHQLLAAILPGTALCLLIVSFFSKKKPASNTYSLFRLFLALFILQFAIALLSGLSLETGLSHFWPSLKNSLLYLVEFSFGRSALFSFLIIGAICYYLLKFNLHHQFIIRVLASLILFLSSFFLSIWSVVINCMMQDPSNLTFISGPNSLNIASIQFNDILHNQYFYYRILHIYQSSIMQGIALMLLVIFCVQYKGNMKFHKAITKTVYVLVCLFGLFLITQPLLGHLQFSNLTEKQPSKAAALEGYYTHNQSFEMYIIGKTNSITQTTTGFKVPSIIKNNLLGKELGVIPLEDISKDKWPPVERVFNAFHVMIVSWLLMLLLFMILSFRLLKSKWNGIFPVFILLILFILTVLASLAGWTLSETGRQPWIFFGKIATQGASIPIQSPFTFWTIIFGNIMLPILLLTIEILLHKRIILNFIKIEKQAKQ